MESSGENCPLFEDLVKLLEEGNNDEVVRKLQTSEADSVKKIVKATDKRKKSEIPTYWYRYRPQYREGFTLLHYAMIYGNSEIVKKLVKLGADPKVKSKQTRSEPESVEEMFNVIHFPCFLGKLENLKALLKECNLTKNVVQYLVNDPYGHKFVDGKEDTWIWTPLHYACGGNNKEILELLLGLGASPFEKCVLHYASRMSDKKIVNRLLNFTKENGCNLEQEINRKDGLQMTPLHYACQKRNPGIVELLLKNGADPLLEDKYHHTPLFIAIWNGSQECALNILAYIPDNTIIENFMKRDLIKKIIEKGLAGVLVHIVDTYTPAFRKMKDDCRCLLHKVILSDSFSLEDLSFIVKSLGKHCIEEQDNKEEDMTPMLLAASKNKHKKLGILFNAYINLLEKNKFYSEKKHYQHLYKEIVDKKDRNGYAMVHLAVLCSGSDTEFESTLTVFNHIRKKLKSLDGLEEIEKDPFMITWKNDDNHISAVELALKDNKPERALSIITATKARTVNSIDQKVIQVAIESGMSVVDFERMVTLIISTFRKDGKSLSNIFNKEDGSALADHPLHCALTRKMFGHVEILLGKKCNEIVKLKISEDHEESTLYIALVNSAPLSIIEAIMNKLQKMDSHYCQQFAVPMTDGVQVYAVGKIYDTADKIRRNSLHHKQEPQFSLSDVLLDAVKEKRLDVFESLIVNHRSRISISAMKEIVFDKQKEEYAKIAVRHSEPVALFEVLVEKIECDSDDGVDYTTCFNELIKTMPDVAMEALHVSISLEGDMNTELLEQYKSSDPESQMDVENGNNLEMHSLQSENESQGNIAQQNIDLKVNGDIDHSKDQDKAQNGINQHKSQKENQNKDQNEGQDGCQIENPDGNQITDLDGNQNEGPNGKIPSKKDPLNPLEVMVQHRQEKLLQHPLVTYYLNREWLTVGFWAYCLKILLYFPFLVTLSALAQIIRHPVEDTCNYSAQLLQNSSQSSTGFWTTIGLSTSSIFFLALEALYSLIIFAIFNNKRKIKKIFKRSSLAEFLLHFTTIALSVTFLIVSIYRTIREDCHSKATWRVGVFAIVLAWTYFVKLISELPLVGEYALPFIAICKTFLKLTLFGILLIFASTIVLDMIFYNPMAPSSPFSTFDGSLIKLITMVTGEIDFHDTFGFSFAVNEEPNHEIYDRSMAYFIWVLFLILIPILLSNTLIALAVGDASEIKQNATITKLEMRVHWVTGVKASNLCNFNNGLCKNCCLKCLKKISRGLAKLFEEDDIMTKRELSEIKFYHMKMKEERDNIKNKYKYDKNSDGSERELMKTVKELTQSNQTGLRDLKKNNDMALHRLQVGLDHVKKDLKRAATTKP